MWASLLVLVVLFSDHTHPPSSSRLLTQPILETSWMSLCLLSVIMGMAQANKMANVQSY